MKKIITCLILVFILLSISCSNNLLGGNSKYTVTIEVSFSNSIFIIATIDDTDSSLVKNAKITIDNDLIEENEFGIYNKIISPAWEVDTTHTYSIETPDGKRTEGTLFFHSDTLTGVTCNPEDEIVSTHTLTPPNGKWPENSYINGWFVRDSKYEPYNLNPNNQEEAKIQVGDTSQITEFIFHSSIRKKEAIENYAEDSYVYVQGKKTEFVRLYN